MLNVEYPKIEFWISVIEPAHVKRVHITQANSEGSGEPAHPCSLARAFTIGSHKTGTRGNFRQNAICLALLSG